MATDRHTRGTAFTGVITSAVEDLAVTPVTLVLDDAAGGRTVWRWRPAGVSASQFVYAAGELSFELSSTATAAIPLGLAVLTLLSGDPATAQQEEGRAEILFEDLPDGAAPVLDP